jgi:hypothetical protein
MKTSTLLLIGGAAVAAYYLTRKTATVAATRAPTGDTSDGGDASAADITAANDKDQSGANAITPTVVVVQPDDSYDAYYGPDWGWGPSWGGFFGNGGGGRRHHGGHHGGHGGHH